MKTKIIILSLIAFLFGLGLIIDSSKTRQTFEKNYKTEYKDDFRIETDQLGKTFLFNEESGFSCRIQYYSKDDKIITLCDTPNVRIYQLSNVNICKIKGNNNFISLNWYEDKYYSDYDYLIQAIVNDSEAQKYLNEFLNEYTTNIKETTTQENNT